MLMRKISMNRWHRNSSPFQRAEDVEMDTITRDLKTTDNALSFWSYDDDEGFYDAVVAFASNMDRTEKLHFLLVEEQELNNRAIPWRLSAGVTKFHGYKDRHVDAGAFDYGNLREVLELILNCFKSEERERIRLVDRQTLKKALKRALQDGKIKIEELSQKMAAELI